MVQTRTDPEGSDRLDDMHRPCEATEDFSPTRGNDDNLLETHPKLSREVDPRLYAERHPLLKEEVICVRHRRRFVFG